MRRFMDRMKAGGMFLLIFFAFSGRVWAAEGEYSPAYMTSPSAALKIVEPSAELKATPPATTEVQPEVTCTLRTTTPTNKQAPLEVKLSANGKMDGKELMAFRYLFGDGESATGSGEVRHTYLQEGSYQIRVTPMVEGNIQLPICKTKIIVEPSKVETTLKEATAAAEASQSGVMVQPKTGPPTFYWAGWVTLLVGWLGAITWYRNQRPQIG